MKQSAKGYDILREQSLHFIFSNCLSELSIIRRAWQPIVSLISSTSGMYMSWIYAVTGLQAIDCLSKLVVLGCRAFFQCTDSCETISFWRYNRTFPRFAQLGSVCAMKQMNILQRLQDSQGQRASTTGSNLHAIDGFTAHKIRTLCRIVAMKLHA